MAAGPTALQYLTAAIGEQCVMAAFGPIVERQARSKKHFEVGHESVSILKAIR
jgi:hypothetical protein